MLAVVVTGMPGAGKESVVERAILHGFSAYRMGDVVRRFATDNGISPEETGIYAARERELHGKDIWARRVMEQVLSDSAERVVIDGCRSDFEVEVFRRHFGRRMSVMAVHSSPATRFERLKRRGRADAPATREEFDERDRRELGWGVGRVIALADEMVVNEGTMQEFLTEVDAVIERLSAMSGKL